jgi:hypothetical protein
MTVGKDPTRVAVVTIEHQERWRELLLYIKTLRRSCISLDALVKVRR